MKKILMFLVLFLTFESFARGNCQCPDNHDRAGRRCGKRSAFCRPGGDSPAYGTKNQKEWADLFRRLVN